MADGLPAVAMVVMPAAHHVMVMRVSVGRGGDGGDGDGGEGRGEDGFHLEQLPIFRPTRASLTLPRPRERQMKPKLQTGDLG